MLAALAERLPADVVLVEETPVEPPGAARSACPHALPMGFVSGANGGLGFGLSGSIGLRMGNPDRPVVAVLGDGASLYTIQALWSAARYDVGVLLIVMANGGYAVMDALARAEGGDGAWPGSSGRIDIAAIAGGFGCPAARVETHDQLLRHARRGDPDPRASGASRCSSRSPSRRSRGRRPATRRASCGGRHLVSRHYAVAVAAALTK